MATLSPRAICNIIDSRDDRSNLGDLAPTWCGTKLGKIAYALVAGAMILPRDEIGDPPAQIAGEDAIDVVLSKLEPGSARAFIGEHVEVANEVRSALWLAGANEVSARSTLLLDRMLVVDVPCLRRGAARATRRVHAGEAR